MTRLSISLLGPMQVAVDGQAVATFEYNKVRALLAYLAVEAERVHHREVLAELLWPERPASTSRSNLRKTLSTLRRALRDDDSAQPLLLTTRETVQFNTASDHWLDVSEFVQCVQNQDLRRAAELYRGPFMDQFLLSDSLAFEHWQLNRRQWLHRQALETLETLAARCEASRELEQAAQYARRQVELEPWHEDAHRRLMRLYFRLGQRGAALAQYETCRRALAEELGVEPGEQTLSLYESLRLEEPQTSPANAAPTRNPYAARAMLKDPSAFVGRDDELHDLFTLLAAMQNCSIVGPRRIGKSSLLYYLTHPAVYSAHLPDPARYLIAFMDLQELAGAGQDEFFYTALQRLLRAGRDIGGLGIDLERDGTARGFRRFLMRAGEAGLRLVLCCDEFELLSRNPYFSAEFFTYLRGLCSNYDLALVTASQASLFDLCQQNDLQTSEFWNIFVERALGLMPPNEAARLIREPFASAGLPLGADEQDLLLQLAGPHPFFIQIACYHLFAARAAQAGRETAKERFLAEAHRYYAHAWNRLDEAQQETLRQLAQAETLPLPAARWQSLRREALVVGSPQAARLVSEGWRTFISETCQA